MCEDDGSVGTCVSRACPSAHVENPCRTRRGKGCTSGVCCV